MGCFASLVTYMKEITKQHFTGFFFGNNNLFGYLSNKTLTQTVTLKSYLTLYFISTGKYIFCDICSFVHALLFLLTCILHSKDCSHCRIYDFLTFIRIYWVRFLICDNKIIMYLKKDYFTQVVKSSHQFCISMKVPVASYWKVDVLHLFLSHYVRYIYNI